VGNPAFVLVICSVAAILVVFVLHALVRGAVSRTRRGFLVRLVDALVAKLVIVIYICVGLAAVVALAAQLLPDDASPLPPKTPWSPKKAFSRLLHHEKPRAGQPQSRFTDALSSIDRDAALLQEIARTHTIPPEYLRQLSVDAWQVWRHQKDPQSPDEMILSAAQDLRAKSLYASRNPANPFSSIPVKATIHDEGGGELQNYEVRFCLKGLLPYADRHRSFDRRGSPTMQQLPPGSYFLWIRRADYMLWANRSGTTVPRQELDLGANGESERNVDFLAR
jgi:hypothetical protein